MRQSERWAESEIHAAPSLGILIASDVRFVRESLGEVLGRSGNFSVLGECGDLDEILSMSRELRPDMVLLDAAVRDGLGGGASVARNARRTACCRLCHC